MLADFIRFLGYSGGRYRESLRLEWKEVYFEMRQITFGSDGPSKNGKARVVDFNPALEAHLHEMHARCAPSANISSFRLSAAAATSRRTTCAEAFLPRARVYVRLCWSP